MAIRSGFFNSVAGDRKYDAGRFAEYFNSFIGNGVFPNPSNGLQVISNDDMTVTAKAGKAWINGYIIVNDDDYILALDVADGVLDRIDRVVLRYDVVDREIRIEVKKGTFASSPVAPTLQRDADAYELGIADIYIGKGVISINQGNITDLRQSSEHCGIVHGTVDQVDVTTLYNQYTQGFELKQDEFEQEFMTWFQTLQDVLDENTAANLLNMINEDRESINSLDAEVVAHKDNITSLEGRHGIRYSDGKLDVKDSGEWVNLINKADPSSWEGVQYIVRSGLANEHFSIGDQLVSSYDGGEIIWEVIGIDVDTPTDSRFTHSMTLQTRNCLHNIQFDAKEPNNSNSDRQSYGNNRYIHSAVRQWLNSNKPVFNWKSQHSYDATPTDSLDLYNGAGFLYRLDPELVSVLGAVNKKVAKADVDGGGQDSFSDKVFLLSQVEVDLGTEGTTTGETVYPYYSGIGNAGRIKTLADTARPWWLRSPCVSLSSSVRLVRTDGSVDYYNAYSTTGVSPACVII